MINKALTVMLKLLNLFLLVVLINSNVFAGNIKGKVHLKDSDKKGGTIIYIEHISGTFSPPGKKIIIDQKDLEFIPRVLPVLVGSTVTFLNSDDVLHNVFSPTKCAGSFNLGTWPTGQERTHTFTKAGCFVTILCNVHPYMQAWIVVLQNPYFVETDSTGNFEIKNIPDGEYTLKVWHPFYKTVSTKVKIKGTGIINRNFSLDKLKPGF